MRRTKTSRRRGTRAVIATATCAMLLPTAAAAQAGDWPSIDADGQGTRQGPALGPVDPVVDWVWDDDTYVSDGSIGGTRTAIPGVLDTGGRLIFKSRNTNFDDADQYRYDLLALDPADGSASVLLPDVNDDYCAPAVAPDGSVWTFQDRNDRTEDQGFADHSAAAVVRIEDGEVTYRYSGPGGDTAGVFGCSDGMQVAPDGTIVFRDSPAAGGILDGTFTPWLRAFSPEGGLRWEQFYDPEELGRNFNQPWVRLAPADTPAEGTVYAFSRTDGTPGIGAFDLATGDLVREIDLPGTAFSTAPVVDPEGGIVVALEQGSVGNDGHVVRVADDAETLSIDWQQQITYDRSRTDGLMALPRSLQVHGDQIVAFSDTGRDIERFHWADGSYVGNNGVGSITSNDSELAIDTAGNAYVTRLSGGGEEDPVLDVFNPAGGRIARMLKGAIAAENDGEVQGARTVGPIAEDGTLYLWGGDNNWVSVSSRTATRVAGQSRFDTAARLATTQFPRGVDTVLLTTGRNYPDALTAGPLAAHLGAPVLLTDPAVLPSETRSALDELSPRRVIALGGAAAVSDQVLADAANAGDAEETDRIWGPSRYGTAAAVAERLPETGTIYLAVGTNYVDALAGGPATDGAPILLTETGHLPQETRAVLADRRPDRVVALGGSVAVSEAVLDEAARAAGGATTGRLAGQTRYSTGVEIAQSVVDSPAFGGTVFVAVGTSYPDAVSAASAADVAGAPIVLTAPDQLPDEVRTWLAQLDGLEHVVILGGTGAVSPRVERQLANIVG